LEPTLLHSKHRGGFTFAELLTVVVIVGVLAGLALPRFMLTMERMKVSEGTSILTILYSAQKRYAVDNDGQYTSDITQLDVNIPSSQNYNSPVAVDPSFTDEDCFNGIGCGPVARIDRRNGGPPDLYRLEIIQDGTVTCQQLATPYTCSQLGF